MPEPINPLLAYRRLVLSRLPYSGIYIRATRPCELLIYHSGMPTRLRDPLEISLSVLAPSSVEIVRPELIAAPPMAMAMCREIERRMGYVQKHRDRIARFEHDGPTATPCE